MLNGAKPAGLVFMMLALAWSRGAPANTAQSMHLVSRIVGQEFLSETIRIGDLNGDGAPDVLFVQDLYGPRIITCLTATTLAGKILWQTGTPSKDNGRAYCDLPVQIYDWDQDGTNEVILFGSRGFCVYANARPYEKGSLYNMNLYPGM